MLILDAIIHFNKPDEHKDALQHDLDANLILRPAINFGNNILFSGTIVVDKELDTLIMGRNYKAIIEMPQIDREAFQSIASFVHKENSFLIQSASRIVGNGTIHDFEFEE